MQFVINTTASLGVINDLMLKIVDSNNQTIYMVAGSAHNFQLADGVYGFIAYSQSRKVTGANFGVSVIGQVLSLSSIMFLGITPPQQQFPINLNFKVKIGDWVQGVDVVAVGANITIIKGNSIFVTGQTDPNGVYQVTTADTDISQYSVKVEMAGHKGVLLPIGNVVFGQLVLTLEPTLFSDEFPNSPAPG
jgi:hypothetical protein